MMNVLPAGQYLISDPCYVFDRERYDALLEETNYFGLSSVDPQFARGGGIFVDKVTGLKFAVVGTAYGDGLFSSNDGDTYPVDAGCIAIIPFGMLDTPYSPYGHGGAEFKEDFAVEYLEDGTIKFGHVEIYTARDVDDKDDEWDDGVDEAQEWYDYDAGC